MVDGIITQLERQHRLPEGRIDPLPRAATVKGFADLAGIVNAGTRVPKYSGNVPAPHSATGLPVYF